MWRVKKSGQENSLRMERTGVAWREGAIERVGQRISWSCFRLDRSRWHLAKLDGSWYVDIWQHRYLAPNYSRVSFWSAQWQTWKTKACKWASRKKASKQVLPRAWCVFECYSGLLVLTRSPHGSWADLLRKLQPRTHHGQHSDKYTQSIHQIGCACLNYDQEGNQSVGRFFIRCEGSLWLCIVRRRSLVDRDWAEKYPKLLHQFLTMASDQGRGLSCC